MLLQCFLAATALAPHRRHEHHVTRVLRDLPASHHHLKLNLPNASWYNEALANHFDTYIAQGTPRRWSQRYYVDARFWCGSGCPVFLYIGGEGPQGPVSDHLFMWTLAEEHGALMFALEHRFYGESRPTADMSDKSLELLTPSKHKKNLETSSVPDAKPGTMAPLPAAERPKAKEPPRTEPRLRAGNTDRPSLA